MEYNGSNVGNNIRKWRMIKNFKQVELAKLVGICESTFSKIENNKAPISLLRLEKIASCLNLKTT